MIIKQILRFFVVVVIQIFILNQLQFSGYINPYLYIIFILLLPIKTPQWLSLSLAFILGLTIDVFSQSPGLHTSATLFMAYIRPSVMYSLKISGELNKDLEPNLNNMETSWVLMYISILILAHHTVYFFLEAFSFSFILNTVYSVLFSSMSTFVVVVLAQLLTFKKSQK
ncbi:MAG: rod shape-determining protein MreD [Bacteroidetes bacterium 4572_77]|nr:MAG: rod shape-determining protein MreD [Bacteroidetes bacterium 4572_77]